MAGNRIKGITVEIGGDTKGLSKALSGVNKQINTTQSELRDVERLLKLDPTNTNLLEQRHRLLADAVTNTSQKLDSLKEAEKQVQQQFERGEISQQQYDALKREIIDTEQQLKKLEDAASKSNAALAGISAAADKVADATGKAASATKGLSAAAGGILVGLGGAAVAAGKSADDINTLAKQTGLATDDIQKFMYATDVIDVSLDTLTGSMAKLTKNMSNAQKGTGDAKLAFDALGVSITDNVTGELRNNKDVFNDAIAALGKMENETQRDAYAMQIFGKSAQDLNPLILGGADALWELGNEAEQAGLILSQDALDGANEFNDSIDTLKATAQGTFMELGTEIATMLIPFMESLSAVLKDVMAWIRDLDEGQLEFIGTILLVVASISPLLGIISKLAGGISFLTGTVIPGISSALSFLAANPIVLVIGAIVALIAIIANFGDEIQAVLGRVDDFLQNIFAKDWTETFGFLGEYLNAFMANVKNIWNAVKKIFDGVIDFIRGVFTGNWERAWGGVVKIFGGIFDGIIAIAKAPLNGVIGLLNMAIGGINALLSGLNKIKFDIPDWVPGLGGKSFGINIPSIPKIPYLADGAAIQPNNPFAAILGDQKSGMNVEAPEGLIRSIFEDVLAQHAGGGVNIEQFNNYDTDVDIPVLTRKISIEMQRQNIRMGRAGG